MNEFLRRVRGVVATGLIWSPAWIAMFAALVGGIAIFRPFRGDAGPIRMAVIIGWVGFVSGVFFAVMLSLAERGKSVRDLSSVRAAVWGALGAAVFPLVTGRADQVFWTVPFGMIAASVLVALARRAAAREGWQPGSRNLLAAVLLTPLRDTVHAAAQPKS